MNLEVKKKILVVDDRINSLKVVTAILSDEGYEVLKAADGTEALKIYDSHEDIDLVLSDLKMPGTDGLQLYHKITAIREAPPFIIMTAYGTVKSAVEALKEGVTNYLIKPLDYEELTIILNKAIHEYEISRELRNLKKQVRSEYVFHNIIGTSRKMRAIFDMVRTVGPTDASVMIYGETGTGKELLARSLHMESSRKKAEMVCINSAALTENLLEAELFGHVKGAFTGAGEGRKGRLELADQGTLFLDEIGYMSLRLQAKLLRFLQEKTFEPVGATSSRQVDVRVIAATNFDLQEEIRKNRFLSDLLYRIEVIPIRVPALRDRREDIPLLVSHFVRHYAVQYEKVVDGVTPETMDILTRYNWPGNVRELKNCLARAVLLSKGPRLMPDELSEGIVSGAGPSVRNAGKELLTELPEKGITLRDMESELIRKTLEKCNGNKSLASQCLGISRKTLYEKIGRYGISKF
ncbi:sigma-54-dependent transcriptional regulator [Desulfonema magnum]|uniref:Two component system response regulator, sigma54-specific n=1 Tax=Desulfonema magnum TaxID=45655 RepID=A0A975BRU8_9BACT|nr:sigma-54 dependent transcriptional regulator [Desulfonema magnum]QTA90526.1 Two component system response regulator, sigma54-specific [Desulfonema magnum]